MVKCFQQTFEFAAHTLEAAYDLMGLLYSPAVFTQMLAGGIYLQTLVLDKIFDNAHAFYIGRRVHARTA